ncbi:MAG: SDR family oxidoreductase [Bacteroidia bacterium]|nr:SDR family oxidoreductase [Bacteroidia bacterium]NND26729.1 SDR family oxidoreductase [Flavobacteriaceae bacterium]MBT8278133.1 SDR family oxidoreductase [Bacteroidia bacterium]NNK61345.1 SDR family oxidoreductase [Flavobacteriaceae bacterium]NNL33211.1 SDR family oxidoreductase [Flavobacteriaceae bacterium]
MSKVVLITGGSSGIGKSIGEFLSKLDFVVVGTSRNPNNYQNSSIPLYALDVTQNASILSCIDQVKKEHGTIDILINNAGAGITGPVEEIPDAEIRRNFDINFFGPINVIKGILPIMRSQNSGLIINITSIAGYMGLPYRGPYSASKSALGIITEAFRMEIKDTAIQMCNLAPGDFATNIAAGRYHAPVIKGSPYETKYSEVLNTINDDVNTAGDPQLVAKAILKIINSKRPKIHYKVGTFMQKISVLLKAILPDKAYEKLLSKHYNL